MSVKSRRLVTTPFKSMRGLLLTYMLATRLVRRAGLICEILLRADARNAGLS